MLNHESSKSLAIDENQTQISDTCSKVAGIGGEGACRNKNPLSAATLDHRADKCLDFLAGDRIL